MIRIVTLALVAALVWPQQVHAQLDFANYAEYAPGTPFLERGNRFFEQQDYAAAADYYRLAAHWADKLAQFNLGILHVNGDGVPRDPLRGWAWIRLAAERGYPKFARVANDLWSRFSEEQKRAARTILEQELEPAYGDAVAVERTAREMQRERDRAVGGGSRVGVNRTRYVSSRDGQWVRGDSYYDPARWDFRRIIEFETRLQRALGGGEVILRDFDTIDDPAEVSDDNG